MAKVKLTPEIQRSICAFIRKGAFPHVACEAAGVPEEVFLSWLEWGSPRPGKRARKPYSLFLPRQPPPRRGPGRMSIGEDPPG
jgi:hypothetical protein